MAFPKLSEVSMYPITIPSLGLETRFRPYLVKEEKVLLIASEQNDADLINEAVLDLVKSCIEAEINEKNLTTYDVEYLFCNIRAKSVGEVATLGFACSHEECFHQTEVKIRIEDATIDWKDQKNNIIEISENVSVEMGHITYNDIIRNSKLKDAKTDSEIIYLSTIMSMKYVITDDERIDVADETFEELVEFVNNMTTEQFNLLREYATNSPEVKLDVTWECEACHKENQVELRGMADFF
jgi:hypothetical protein